MVSPADQSHQTGERPQDRGAPTPDPPSNGVPPAPDQWYVIRTRALAEYRVADTLHQLDLAVFFPRIESDRPRRGHSDIPLFPGYLFVGHVPGRDWSIVSQVPGVLGPVAFDGQIPLVPDQVVAEVARRSEEINQNGGLSSPLRPGDRVLVRLGSTERFAEVVAEVKPRRRVRVLMEFLGKIIQAEVSPEDIVRAAQEMFMHPSGYRPRRTRGRNRWIKGQGPRAQEA